jgi:transcriptional regulator with XRE-family HTH domain
MVVAFSHATPYTAGRTAQFDTRCDTVTQRRLADYIGITVRRLRSDRDFTLQALADESGVSKSYLGDIEKGRKNPTTDVIEAIAEALGVPARELLYHAALDEDDPFFEPEQLSLEDVAEEDAETRELAHLARRIRIWPAGCPANPSPTRPVARPRCRSSGRSRG